MTTPRRSIPLAGRRRDRICASYRSRADSSMPALFIALAAATLHPWVPSSLALVGGAALALTVGNPLARQTGKWIPRLLQISIIGLGASMNLGAVLRVGAHGIAYTLAGI